MIVLLLTASSALIFQPVQAESGPETEDEVFPGWAAPPSRIDYDGDTYTVGPTPDYDSATIQGAVDLCSDGDMVLVSSGSYQEEVVVSDEIWIMGGTGVELVPLAAPITNNGFYLRAHNVTITEFNITNFNIAVYSSTLGHNISGNEFFKNTRDLYIEITGVDLQTSYIGEGLMFMDNVVTKSSTGNSVEVEIDLDFDHEKVTHAKLGDYIFLKNHMRSVAIAGDFIEFEIDIKDVTGGSVEIGDFIMRENVMRGHGLGLDFNGDNIRYLEDVDVDIGEVLIRDNRILEHDDGGINLNYYDLEYLYGTTTVHMGDVTISDNNVRTSGFSESIYINNFAYWREFYNDTYLESGNVTIEGNTMDGGSYGVYLYNSYSGAHLHHNSKTVTGSLLIRNNKVLRSGYGIYVEVQDGYYLYDESHGEIGDVTIIDNHVVSKNDAIYVYYYYLGADMYDRSTFFIGDLLIKGNEVYGSDGQPGYSGIELYIYEIGYYMHDGSRVEMGDISVIDNDIWGYYGLYWDYFEYIGYDMEGDSVLILGDINVSSNRIRARDDGIYISEFYDIGYDLSDNADVTLGRIDFNMNDIRAGDLGFYWYDFEYVAYRMEGASTFTMDDISICNNTIVSDDNGIYLYYFDCWGTYLYGYSSVQLDSILINDNIIISNQTGIYSNYFDSFGYTLYDNSSFEMKNIEFNRNTIRSVGEGLYIYYLEYFGYNLYNWSSFAMGSVQVNDNVITADYDGIYIYEFYYFGSEMEERSTFTMDNIEINGNEIMSNDHGIYLGYIEYFANSMYGTSTFSMDLILINDNLIVSNATGIYFYEIYDLGYSMYDNSTADFNGLHMDGNDVRATYDGILFEYIYYLGEDLYNDTVFNFGNITLNENVVVSGGDGITINEHYRCLSDMDDNARGHIGWIQMNHNQIDSGQAGISFDNFNNFGSRSKGRSVGRSDGVQIMNNSITAEGVAISMDLGSQFALNMEGMASMTMGPWIISENAIVSSSEAVIIYQAMMGSNMISGDPIMEGVRITENIFDSSAGIEVRFSTATMTGTAKVRIEEILIDNNQFLRTVGVDGIYLGVSTILSDDASFFIESTKISNNQLFGADLSLIHIDHSESESGNSESDLGTVTIMGNNITGGGTGVEFVGVQNANVYVNNFIANMDDVESGTGSITWTSPEPMWYRYGMKNLSSYLGNYWDQYSGPDNNNDGIGDNPYNTGSGLDTKPLVLHTWEILPPWNDETPPEINILSPSDGAYIPSDNVTMNWTVTDDLLGVENQWVRSDDGPWVEVNLATGYTFHDLGEGEHSLWVRAVDVAGNRNETSVGVTIDLSAPDVWFLSPENGSAFNRTSVDLEYNASDRLSGISFLEITIDDGEPHHVGTELQYTLSDLSEGTHVIRLSAYDGAGLMGYEEITLLIDLTDPVIDPLHPTDGMVLTEDRVNATWLGDGGLSGVGRYLIALDGGNLTDVGLSTNMFLEDLDNGEHSLELVCYDGAGNFISRIVEFTVDTTASVVEITYPADGSFINEISFGVRWNLNGMVHPMEKVEFRIDSENWTAGSEDGAQVHNLSEGEHTLDLRVFDTEGTTAEATSRFTVDLTAPELVSASHQGTSAPARGPIEITFSEPIGNTVITLDGEPTVLEIDGNVVSIIMDDITGGADYRFEIDAEDLAGNTFTGELSFTTAQKGKVTGRIVDEEGNPIEGARVVFDTGEEAVTDENGEFSVDVPDGQRTAIVYDKDGNEIGTFDIDVVGGQDNDSGDHTVEPKESEGTFPWWILILIALVILVLIVVVLLVVRSGDGGIEEEMEDPWEEGLDEELEEEEFDEDSEMDEDEEF